MNGCCQTYMFLTISFLFVIVIPFNFNRLIETKTVQMDFRVNTSNKVFYSLFKLRLIDTFYRSKTTLHLNKPTLVLYAYSRLIERGIANMLKIIAVLHRYCLGVAIHLSWEFEIPELRKCNYKKIQILLKPNKSIKKYTEKYSDFDENWHIRNFEGEF